MKIAIITQARMSSTRLPGKVMLKINHKTLLEYHIERAQKSNIPIIVATSLDQQDGAIIQLCNNMSVPVFRGSLYNVLSRFYHCAKKYKLNTIIRITSDCPLIDGELIAQGLIQFNKLGADYLSNTVERTFPRGFDFEIFTIDALTKAYKNATLDFQKEHVTPYIWQNKQKQFTIHAFTQKRVAANFRLTVDTPEDFQAVAELIEKYRADTKNVNEIINILDTHPEIVQINAHIEQKKI